MHHRKSSLSADDILEIQEDLAVAAQLLSGSFDSELARLKAANEEYKGRQGVVDTLEEASKIRADAVEFRAQAQGEINAKMIALDGREQSIDQESTRVGELARTAERVANDAMEQVKREAARIDASNKELSAREEQVRADEAAIRNARAEVESQRTETVALQDKLKARLAALHEVV